MAKILLLDDSAVMHRVVRLTFADDSQKEIVVARTPAEVDHILSAGQIDLIIAYVRFSGVVDPRYFEALSYVSPRILLLAEGDENLDDFYRAGLTSILRKPFHSDELRQVVEELLQREALGRSSGASQFGSVPMARDNPFSEADPHLDQNDDTIDFSTRAVVREQKANRKDLDKAHEEFSSQPKITMDLSFLESTSVSTPSKPPIHHGLGAPSGNKSSAEMVNPVPGHGQSGGTAPVEKIKSYLENEALEKMKQSVVGTPFEKMFNPARASAAAGVGQRPRSVEPAAWDSAPMTLENVIINKHDQVEEQKLSRLDVEKIVEDAVAIAVSKAVRQALNETLPDLRQALVVEVSQKAVDQLNSELYSVKRSLRETMLQEIREVSAQWLRRETPILAKDVIREEIRKVIESVTP